MSNFDPAMAARVRAERARAELEDNAVENGILQDGHSLIVPLFMADGNINPTLTFAQRLMAEKVQKAAMDAAASTSTTGGPTMTTRNYTLADAERFGLKDASALSRPGFRYNGADPYARDQAIISYSDYDADAESAWKMMASLPYTTEVTGAGSKGPSGSLAKGFRREGDSCQTAEGGRGRKVDMGGGRLVCVAEPHASSYLAEGESAAQDGLSARDVARIEYEDALCNAWRNPTGSVPASDSVVLAPQRLDLTKDVQRPDLTKDVATIQKEHSVRMQALYDRIDQEISEAYKAR